MSMGGGSSKSSTTPVDMTPQVFKNFQGPFAARLAGLLGINPNVLSGAVQFPGIGGSTTGTTGSIPPMNGGPVSTHQRGYTARTGQKFDTIPDGAEIRPNGEVWRGGGRNGVPTLIGFASPAPQPRTIGGGGTDTPFDWSKILNADPLSGIPTYGGKLTADMSPNETALLQQLMQETKAGGGPKSPAEAMLQKIMGDYGRVGAERPVTQYNREFTGQYNPGSTLAGFADELAAASNTGAFGAESPFLRAAIEAAQRPTMEALTETLGRELPGRFTQAGQFIQPQGSSAFDRAAAIATRGASNTLGDIATNISYQALEGARGREASALESELGRRFTGQQSALDRQLSEVTNIRGLQNTEREGIRDRALTQTEGFRNRALEAAKSLPGVNAQEVDTLIKNLQAQGLPRLIQDQGITRGLELFNTRLDALIKTLGITAGVTAPTISQQSDSKSSQFSFGLK